MCSERLLAMLLGGCFLVCLACAAPSQRHGGQSIDIPVEVDGYTSMVQSRVRLDRAGPPPSDDRRPSLIHDAGLQELLLMAQQSSTVRPQAAAAVEKTEKALQAVALPAEKEDNNQHPLSAAKVGVELFVNSLDDECHAALCSGEDTSPYTAADSIKVVHDTWTWKQAYCKLETNPDACLWKGCVAEGNLTKGALDYLSARDVSNEAAYCFREHCSNREFDLQTTTLSHAQQYCDRKFGDAWRRLTAGLGGYGWPGQHPGSGVWECAHANYHCDWAYCKIGFCNVPKYQAQFAFLEGVSPAPS